MRIQYRGMPTIYARLPLTELNDRKGTGPSYLPDMAPATTTQSTRTTGTTMGSKEFQEVWDRTANGVTTQTVK